MKTWFPGVTDLPMANSTRRRRPRNHQSAKPYPEFPLTDAGLAHLAGPDTLTSLNPAKTKVTAKGVDGLAKAPRR